MRNVGVAVWLCGGVVAAMGACGGEAASPGPAAQPCVASELRQSPEDFFVDVSEASGLTVGNFVPEPPSSIPINDHSRLAFVDLDGDGYDDVVMHSLYPNPKAGIPFEHLVFRNRGDGTFEDFSEASGLKEVQAGFFAFGDVDNDGDLDCFAGLDIDLDGQKSALYLNDGTGRFSRKEDSGLGTTSHPGNAAFADFNLDGKLDLFLGNGHTSFSERDQLFFGRGDGTFEEVSASSLPDRPRQPSNGVVVCDVDSDGDLDVLVSTYGVSVRQGWNQAWINQGDGTFVEGAEAMGFHALATGTYFNAKTGHGRDAQPDTPWIGSNGFGIDCGDIDGDGQMDIYLATISHADGADKNRLWSDPSQVLLGSQTEQGYRVQNVFLDRGLPFNEGEIDAALVDYDNDGRLDLSVSREDKYEANYDQIAQKGFFGLFRQRADGSFDDVGYASGINDRSGATKRMKRGQNLAWSDIDLDGDVDLLVGGRDQGGGRANYLFRNELGAQNDWLALRLVGDGKDITRDAFGARVTVRVGERTVVREKKSSRGTYNSSDGTWLMFGLGDLGACVEGRHRARIEVRWPNGVTQAFEPSDFSLRAHYTVRYQAPLERFERR